MELSHSASLYFYNKTDYICEPEKEKATQIAIDKCTSYITLLENYDEWKKLVRNYNKYIPIKHRKKDCSRYEWHKEVDRAKKKLNFISTEASIEDIISTAYNDSFYRESFQYYPIEYPQIFKIQLTVNNINKIFENKDSAINYFENLPETCILGVQGDEKPSWKEISNNLTKFFEDNPHGLIWVTNDVY